MQSTQYNIWNKYSIIIIHDNDYDDDHVIPYLKKTKGSESRLLPKGVLASVISLILNSLSTFSTQPIITPSGSLIYNKYGHSFHRP